MIHRMLANCTVTDLDRAEQWYARLFERGPDARPMPGLIEWHLDRAFGLQVWSEPDRAGGSTVVLDVADLDAAAERAARAGIRHEGPRPGGGRRRILQLADPDGNRVVLTGE
ncbi:VOC family protein [Leucobacter sp. CSA1]|uniref:VOC family protein n=1 Tax=Leucobacter chromiisoli TaxID=2796471 RepID=A0A934Q4H5_9MICO|nr:VOC family protein [Leucobacter chromiisoli]MBK0417458.1 VOC family protein [Leucobacter chromiisoli]